LRTNFSQFGVIALCVALMSACTDSASQKRALAPYARIVGSLEDVGSVVLVDGKPVATIAEPGLSMPEVSVILEPGRRVVEVRKNGVLRVRQVLRVTADSGVILMPASAGSGPVDLSPNEP
jgi:hypothetical protein